MLCVNKGHVYYVYQPVIQITDLTVLTSDITWRLLSVLSQETCVTILYAANNRN